VMLEALGRRVRASSLHDHELVNEICSRRTALPLSKSITSQSIFLVFRRRSC
jgi:hypothetical protein